MGSMHCEPCAWRMVRCRGVVGEAPSFSDGRDGLDGRLLAREAAAAMRWAAGDGAITAAVMTAAACEEAAALGDAIRTAPRSRKPSRTSRGTS